MLIRRGRATAAIAGALLLACARTEPSAGTGVSPPDPAVYARGTCNRFARCAPAYVRSWFGDVDGCVAALTTEAAAIFGADGARITKRELDACILRTESASCEEDVESLPECDFKGTLADGAPCASGIVCASGTCFKRVEDGALSACGVCSPRAPEGAACVDVACAPGLDCVDGTCRAPGGEGARCDEALRCKSHLACVDGACVVPLGRDEPCDPSPNARPCDAAQGLVCDNGACVAIVAEVGAPCTQTPFCSGSACLDGLCVARPGEGKQCDPASPVGCAFPLDCRQGKCTRSDPVACR